MTSPGLRLWVSLLQGSVPMFVSRTRSCNLFTFHTWGNVPEMMVLTVATFWEFSSWSTTSLSVFWSTSSCRASFALSSAEMDFWRTATSSLCLESCWLSSAVAQKKKGVRKTAERLWNQTHNTQTAPAVHIYSPILSSSFPICPWAACSSFIFTESRCWVSDSDCSICSCSSLQTDREESISSLTDPLSQLQNAVADSQRCHIKPQSIGLSPLLGHLLCVLDHSSRSSFQLLLHSLPVLLQQTHLRAQVQSLPLQLHTKTHNVPGNAQSSDHHITTGPSDRLTLFTAFSRSRTLLSSTCLSVSAEVCATCETLEKFGCLSRAEQGPTPWQTSLWDSPLISPSARLFQRSAVGFGFLNVWSPPSFSRGQLMNLCYGPASVPLEPKWTKTFGSLKTKAGCFYALG